MSLTKLASLTLDIYDGGPTVGAILRELGSAPGGFPHVAKEALDLSDPEVRAQLPDDAFGMVVVDDNGGKLRKFACTDPGNTWLSAQLFLRTGDRLKDGFEGLYESVGSKLASNLSAFGLPLPEEFVKENFLRGAEKVLGPVGRGIDFLGNAAIAKNIADDVVPSAKAAVRAGGAVRTPGQMAVLKTAEATVPTALDGKYPLTDLQCVKIAMAYFSEHEQALAPADRRTFCLNVEKRAADYGLPLPAKMRRYTYEGYAEPSTVKAAFSLRAPLLREDAHREILGMLEKSAQLQQSPAVEVAHSLEALDRAAGLVDQWDRLIPDPYSSVLGPRLTVGSQKTAEEGDAQDTEEDFIDQAGSEIVHGWQLRRWSINQGARIAEVFGPTAVPEAQKNPVKFYKGLPMPLRRTVARMAVQYCAEKA